MDSGQILVCRHGGHCKSKKRCLCPPGFNGTNCETDLCAGGLSFFFSQYKSEFTEPISYVKYIHN